MKRILFILAFVFAVGAGDAQAQSWLDALKSVASTAIDKVTGGEFTAKSIIGTWKYVQPGVKLSSSDALSELAASAATSTMQSKMVTYYEKVGIKPGACSFTLNEDGTFSSTFGKKTYGGTYTFDAKTNQLMLKYDSALINWGSIPAYAYMNGKNMQIVFPIDKLVGVLTTLGSSISALSTVTELIKKYDSVKIGFEFTK